MHESIFQNTKRFSIHLQKCGDFQHSGDLVAILAINARTIQKEGGSFYSRRVIMQNKFIAEPNRIRNCDWSLRLTLSFE